MHVEVIICAALINHILRSPFIASQVWFKVKSYLLPWLRGGEKWMVNFDLTERVDFKQQLEFDIWRHTDAIRREVVKGNANAVILNLEQLLNFVPVACCMKIIG